ncbi:TetR/AcrR family transcriptional regulator [Lactobacillus sp. ESL0681]|uniref:TetR/AcrR family transcriptional regulator n=1 Tax=Lactobacillus sp. ESL0681 TaxID=2983211 RepID=UPI0023F6E77D|nr:TetR/AcrR family transcriptional regulator [Lactobacillus sp. ESL0681]WEV40115.1 TetR/AcrR family transcriptional regulator [Lactobacillus sp. ESL0681]
MGKRADNTKQTYQNLLAAAERLIVKDGYENVSVDKIVKESGIAKGTFYNYFKRKEDLIFELSKQRFAHVKTVVTPDSDPLASITTYLVDFVKVIEAAKVQLARQWVRYISANDNNSNKLLFDIKSLVELLEDLVSLGKLAESTPIQQLAQSLIIQIYGVVLSWCIMPEKIKPVALVQSFCELELEDIFAKYLV